MSPRKAVEVAAALPLIGLVLLMPPVTLLFARDLELFGVPLIVAYVFGGWGLMIVLAFALSRWLPDRHR